MSAFGFALIAAFVWGTATFFEKIGLARAEPMAGLWVRCLGVFIGVLALPLVIPQVANRALAMGWKSFVWLLLGGFTASVLGQVFFYRALKMGDVGRVAPVAGAWPLVAFLWSLCFLHEAPSVRTVCGALLVFFGVALLR
jgi:bacterial/archaeal transporter family protein